MPAQKHSSKEEQYKQLDGVRRVRKSTLLQPKFQIHTMRHHID